MGGKGKGKKRKHGGKGGKGGKGKSGGTEGQGKGGKRRHGLLGELPERAFIISSETPQLSPKATKEAQHLLRTALEAIMPPDTTQTADEPQEKSSVSNLLEAELQELRGEGEHAAKRPRISFHGEVTRGIAVLACPRKADAPNFPSPSALVDSVFAAQKLDCTVRYIVRLLPLDVVCSPHLSNFRGAAEKHLPELLAGVAKGSTWYVAIFNRSMTTIKKMDALAVLNEVLGKLGMEMSVSESDFTVMIEVNPSLCGFSVLRDYEEGLHECHLRKATNIKPEDSDDESEDEDAVDLAEPRALIEGDGGDEDEGGDGADDAAHAAHAVDGSCSEQAATAVQSAEATDASSPATASGEVLEKVCAAETEAAAAAS